MTIRQVTETRGADGQVVQQDINLAGDGASYSITVTDPQTFGIFDKINEVFFDIVTTDTP